MVKTSARGRWLRLTPPHILVLIPRTGRDIITDSWSRQLAYKRVSFACGPANMVPTNPSLLRVMCTLVQMDCYRGTTSTHTTPLLAVPHSKTVLLHRLYIRLKCYLHKGSSQALSTGLRFPDTYHRIIDICQETALESISNVPNPWETSIQGSDRSSSELVRARELKAQPCRTCYLYGT